MIGAAEEKALSFLTLMAVGYLLRSKLSDKKMLAGVRILILNALLPAVIFKGLVGVKISKEALGFPLINAVHISAQLVIGFFVARLIVPGAAPEARSARASPVFISSTFAPGLSAFVFIREFAPSGMGMGALMDLVTKAYLLVVLPVLMATAFNAKALNAKAGDSSFLRTAVGLLCEPLNLSIAAGLSMSALGLTTKHLGFLGMALERLEVAQAPVLFLLIGLTVSLSGDSPVICGVMCLMRAACAQICAFIAVRSLGLEGDVAVTLVIMFQSAASVVGYAMLEKVAVTLSAGGKDGEKACQLQLGLDLMSYSFPVSIVLNTAAGLARERYVDLLPVVAGGLVASAVCIRVLGGAPRFASSPAAPASGGAGDKGKASKKRQ